MINYIVKRILYAIPILIGVNLLTFTLFFVVNSPDEVARLHLGNKRVTQEQIITWNQATLHDKAMILTDWQSRHGIKATVVECLAKESYLMANEMLKARQEQ